MSFIGESNFSSDPIPSPWAPSALKQEGPGPSCSLLPLGSLQLLQRSMQGPAHLQCPPSSLEEQGLAPPTRSDSRIGWVPRVSDLLNSPALGRGKGELSASWPPVLLSVHEHSWYCSLWSLSEPICFPSASHSLGNTFGSTAVYGPWGISQQLGRSSLPPWGHATWADAEEWSLQGRPVQTGSTKGLRAQMGHYASGRLSHYPGVWGQAKT